MDRRRVLAASGTSLLVGTSGCLDGSGIPFLSGVTCPDLDESNLENAVDYEGHDIAVDPVEGDSAALVTCEDEIADVAGDDSDAAAILRGLEFGTEFGIALAVNGNGSRTEFRVLGVDRESASRVSVYTCYKRYNRNDVHVRYDRLLVVPHGGEVPEKVRLRNTTVGP